jgi:beta-carotene 3-hydroxylase
MTILLNIFLVIATFFFMEFTAWFTHKYVMHGFLWYLHKDHHDKSLAPHPFEKNDAFFLIFAAPSIVLIVLGIADFDYRFFIGIGIALYGAAYFFIHDLFIHQRTKVLRNAKGRYFTAVRRAHKMHHKHITKEDGESFGMLIVNKKYWAS